MIDLIIALANSALCLQLLVIGIISLTLNFILKI